VQSEILKQYDVRVTVVGERVFATAIWSQDNEETITDWRKGSRPDLRHEKIVLDQRVERQCVKLVQRLGLRYGAIDLVCDQSGKLWFLEINPNGQWAWIENLTGYPIAAAIVDELTVNAIAQT
jgi:glutathione synthase/RimK-type ligase-like ATP-grasp enzyme